MSSELIINVTDSNFQYEVLAYSNEKPVVVDFWAEWCQPCHALTPLLEKLTREANGAFRLAKLNVDHYPKIANQFGVRSLPTVKAFSKSQVVGEFVGAKQEREIRDFLANLVPSEKQLELERGYGLLNIQNWEDAAKSFRKVLESSPDDAPALLGLAKSLLAQGEPGDAAMLLRGFPASREFQFAEILLPLAETLVGQINTPLDVDDDDEYGFVYQRALNLIEEGNLEAAMDGLLDTLRADKNYRDGEARKVTLGVLEMMGEGNPETRKYRNELGSILF